MAGLVKDWMNSEPAELFEGQLVPRTSQALPFPANSPRGWGEVADLELRDGHSAFRILAIPSLRGLAKMR